MGSIHSLIEDNLRESGQVKKKKIRRQKRIPKYPTFKAEVIEVAKTLSNNNLPTGTERKLFAESFELAIKRTSKEY